MTVRVLAAAALAVCGLVPPASRAEAATFFGWQVAGVPAGDLLNVRAFPSPRSRVLVGYPNGVRLSLTGRCTGGLRLDRIAGLPPARQLEAVRGRWCETWLDPTGSGTFRTGWVSGRFIRPL